MKISLLTPFVKLAQWLQVLTAYILCWGGLGWFLVCCMPCLRYAEIHPIYFLILLHPWFLFIFPGIMLLDSASQKGKRDSLFSKGGFWGWFVSGVLFLTALINFAFKLIEFEFIFIAFCLYILFVLGFVFLPLGIRFTQGRRRLIIQRVWFGFVFLVFVPWGYYLIQCLCFELTH